MPRAALPPTLILVGLLILTACAEESTATDAIERYLQAQIAGDSGKLVTLSCPAWEAEAKAAAAAFQSVDAKIDKLRCSTAGSEAEYILVICEGIIVIQYRGEDPRSQSLPEITYRAVKNDGEWKMCGAQEP